MISTNSINDVGDTLVKKMEVLPIAVLCTPKKIISTLDFVGLTSEHIALYTLKP